MSFDLVSILGLVIGLAGLAYALYQDSERRKFADYVRGQNWNLYQKANNANGVTQRALAMYKGKIGNPGFDAELLEFLAKADAFGQDVFKDVIRQIQVTEPKFDQDTIDTWVAEKRVIEGHAALFRNLAPSRSP